MVRAPDRQDDAVVQELREAGLRVTMARQAVLTWLAEHPHSTADTIAEGVREQYGALSLQAIYGVLAACADAGLLRRIEPAGHPARFERRGGGNHPPPRCPRARPPSEIGRLVGEAPCLFTPARPGFP